MAVKKKTTEVSYDLEVRSTDGTSKGKIHLPEEIFGVEVNPALISQAVRVFLANKRQGTRSTKTRSQVTASTRKIYKQKGTGRARHGAIKAPIFVGGGIAHGPKPQDFSLEMPKIMRRKALFSALSEKLKNGQITVVDGVTDLEAKTKEIMKMMTNLALFEEKTKRKTAMIILPEYVKSVYLAGRNIASLSVTEARLLNTYEVMNHANLVFTKDAIASLGKIFLHAEVEAIPEEKQTKKQEKPVEKKTAVRTKAVKKAK